MWGARSKRREQSRHRGRSARRVMLVAVAAVTSVLCFSAQDIAVADSRNDDDMKRQLRQAQREADRAQRQAERDARQAEREARQAERDARRAERENQQAQQGQQTSAQSKRQSSDKTENSDDESSDDTDNDTDNGNGRSASQDADANIDFSSPPPTMEKLLKTWFGGNKPDSHKQKAVSRDKALKAWSPATKTRRTKPSVTAAKTSVPAGHRGSAEADATPPTKLNAKSADTVVRRMPHIDLGTAPRTELLALNASKAALSKARALGFTISRGTQLSKLSLSVTPLTAPQGLNAEQASDLLAQALPDASFAPNQKYQIYKTATGVAEVGNASAATGRGDAQKCTPERCFPEKIIGWKPTLNDCARGVKIGIIDTSIDLTHPAFAGKKFTVSHFATKAPPEPEWHGTGVAAILAGDAKSSTPGLIPNAKFYLADVFHADAEGRPESDTLSMLKAFDWLEATGVKIVNMSLSGPPDKLVGNAIARLSAKGVIFVAAAGNDGPTAPPSYPAAYDQVIAVTAVSKNLRGYRYANRGDYIDVAAPGVAIWTALPGARQGFHSGTSFAAPYITATLATIVTREPHSSPSNLLADLSYEDLGKPGPDPIYGKGLIKAPQSCGGGAVAHAIVKSPAFVPTGSASRREVLPWLGLND